MAWIADYGYIVKFRQGLDDVVRTAVEMLVFEESSRMDRMLDGSPHVQSFSPLV